MKIPKKILKLLDRRYKLATKLASVENELDTWLEKHGANLSDFEIADSTVTGCMIYVDPGAANHNVINYIEERL